MKTEHHLIPPSLFVAALSTALLIPSQQAEASVIHSTKQGFDKCFVPSASAMQTWWDNSPYWNVNLYIGGNQRACAQPNLTPAWIETVHDQGWNFIPTWVGPQAPCTNYSKRISWDPKTAHTQGRQQANQAIKAARSLGFKKKLIIYYDMEGYPNNGACYDAVNSFFDGWGERMRERNQLAGGYGSACASGIAGWGNITNWPHAVWMAHWLYAGFVGAANVWGVACVPDSYWPDHQRIRQYAGDHNETWGGLTFNIDSNAVDTWVQGTNNHNISNFSQTAAQQASPPHHHISGSAGWSTHADKFIISSARDPDWRLISRPPTGDPQAAKFDDHGRGWVITTDFSPDEGTISLAAHASTNWAEHWDTYPIHTFRVDDAELVAGPVWVDFINRDTGWVAIRMASSANFSRGMLFRTQDGGSSWEPLHPPISAEVRFLDAQVGWTAGGAAGHELHQTRDGGHTWARIDESMVTGPATYFVGLPTPIGPRTAVLPITIADADQPRVDFFITEDTGQSWTLTHSVPLTLPPTAPVPTAIASDRVWVVADPGSGCVRFAGDDRNSDCANWPEDIVGMHFDSPSAGWVETSTSQCVGSKTTDDLQCSVAKAAWRTVDGGHTWRPAELRSPEFTAQLDDGPLTGDKTDDPESSPSPTASTDSGCRISGRRETDGAWLGLLALLGGIRMRRRYRRRHVDVSSHPADTGRPESR